MTIGILFDLDGTLLNTLEDLKDATNYALSSLSYPQRSLEEVRRFVGNGAGRLLAQAVPAGVDSSEALAVLKEKYPIAIVSNKPDAAVKPLCAQYFPGIFARGEAADCPRKPAPEMVYKAMAAIGADTCIYVGDSEVDVLTAQNAGVPCLSVTWGFRTREEITGGTHFCDRTEDLESCLDASAEELRHGQ